MPDVVHGTKRRPLVPGRFLFDEATELQMVVPASCRRTGRCHECVVEVRAGGDQLSSPTDQESFLPPGFRLACQARVERAEHDVEFGILARRLRIELAPELGDAPTDLDPDGAPGDRVGMALDVGTTTVVLELVDLGTGRVLGVAAFENPQRFGGSDVMTRISYEDEHPGEQRLALRRAVNHQLRRLQDDLRIDRRRITDALVVGNPTMRDLAFGLDVRPLGRIPYRSVSETALREGTAGTTTVERRAHEVGFLMNPRGRVTGGPLIAGHVGADAAADLVAVGAIERGGSFLLVDIGTNTEIIASDGERILAASSPAGPAFEGGGVRYGMPGADGAIEAVRYDAAANRFDVRIIGGGQPEGICGSGLVDLLAELRRHAILTDRGGFVDRSPELTILADPRITLSRADVGHLAVAKAATAVGQRVLLRRLGLAPEDIDHVYLAGGFANALDVGSAIEIGLLVPVSADRVVRAGNASIAGARALLLSRRRLAALVALTRRIGHVELESEPDFFDLFTDGCLFEPIIA